MDRARKLLTFGDIQDAINAAVRLAFDAIRPELTAIIDATVADMLTDANRNTTRKASPAADVRPGDHASGVGRRPGTSPAKAGAAPALVNRANVLAAIRAQAGTVKQIADRLDASEDDVADILRDLRRHKEAKVTRPNGGPGVWRPYYTVDAGETFEVVHAGRDFASGVNSHSSLHGASDPNLRQAGR